MLEDRAKVVLIRPPYSYEIYKSTYKNRYKVANKWVSAPLPIMYLGAAVLDVGADVRMIDPEDPHVRSTPGTALLYHFGTRIVESHKRHRARGHPRG